MIMMMMMMMDMWAVGGINMGVVLANAWMGMSGARGILKALEGEEGDEEGIGRRVLEVWMFVEFVSTMVTLVE